MNYRKPFQDPFSKLANDFKTYITTQSKSAMATDCKSVPPPTPYKRKILLVENLTHTYFPNGVDKVILAYFLDKIVVTSEYYQAIYEGDLDFIQRVDTEWKDFIAEYDYSHEGNNIGRLMLAAVQHGQMHVAEYFKGRMLPPKSTIALGLGDGKDGGKVPRPSFSAIFDNTAALDEGKMDFILGMWTEEELRNEVFDEVYDKRNVVFLRSLLKKHPHFDFNADDGEVFFFEGLDEPEIVYCMVKHGRGAECADILVKNIREFKGVVGGDDDMCVLRPSTCLVVDMCSMSIGVDVRVCACNNRILRVNESQCLKCREDAAPKVGCTYILRRGENKGKACGKPVVPGTSQCKACARKPQIGGRGPTAIPPPPGPAPPTADPW